MIVHCVGVDRKVGRVVSIGPVQADNSNSSNGNTNDGVYCNMVGNNKRIDTVRCDIPIKGRERIETEALFDSSDGSKIEVCRSDPCKPVE